MFVRQILPARHLLVCEHVTRASLALLQRVISWELPIRRAVSRHSFIWLQVDSVRANDLQTNICNSTAHRRQGPVARATSAFRTRSRNATELSNNIYTPLTRLLKISKLCRTLPRSSALFRKSDFRTLSTLRAFHFIRFIKFHLRSMACSTAKDLAIFRFYTLLHRRCSI